MDKTLTVRQRVIEMIGNDFHQIINPDLINEKTRFIDDLQIGPEHFQDIISSVEETFGVELSESDLDDIKTVNDLIRRIKKCAEDQEINLNR